MLCQDNIKEVLVRFAQCPDTSPEQFIRAFKTNFAWMENNMFFLKVNRFLLVLTNLDL